MTEKKDAFIGIYIPKELKTEFCEFLEQKGMSISKTLRSKIREILECNKKEGDKER